MFIDNYFMIQLRNDLSILLQLINIKTNEVYKNIPKEYIWKIFVIQGGQGPTKGL